MSPDLVNVEYKLEPEIHALPCLFALEGNELGLDAPVQFQQNFE